ncbi:hypothetical protein UNPF46_21370 [Bradyrhizobium sp. UNPF46]|nr:hypothetical protein UNPF46_21370 [Bradyrhizobium sp. UNPF46]
MAPVEAVREAIRRQGKYPEDLTREDRGLLATLDEFHCLNDDATHELARLAGLSRGAYVLDVGCGLGGPSRRLAAEYGCEILAIDITRPFLDVASGLTERATLSGKIELIHGDAVDYSFPRQCFDFVWMQVAAANIFARSALYRNLFRALRPGGRLALYDIFEGPNPGLHFPVPWSFDGTTSALLTEGDTIALCRAAGFKYITGRIDGRAQAWFEAEWRRTTAASVSGAPALGFEILLPRWSEMCASQIVNLREDRLRFGYLVFEKS